MKPVASMRSDVLYMSKHKCRFNPTYRYFDVNRQSGMGYVEYLVVTLAVVIALFAPLPGHGGDAVFDLVLEAIRNFGINSSLLLSLP